tara:strand:- start:16334 stop:16636 length:303 start_codon:yes stop_codon:yes gene_type:complete
MKNLLGILLILIISGCAVNTVQEESVKEKQVEVEKEFDIEKILEENNEVQVKITTKKSKSCSILLNKRVIELNKLVDKEFIKIIKLKEAEKLEDVIVECN